MKKIVFTIVVGLFIFNTTKAQKNSTILDIKKNFKIWQPIVQKEIDSSDVYYNYI